MKVDNGAQSEPRDENNDGDSGPESDSTEETGGRNENDFRNGDGNGQHESSDEESECRRPANAGSFHRRESEDARLDEGNIIFGKAV